MSPLRVSTKNPRYFTDAGGYTIYLTGIQYEDALREDGSAVPTAVDYMRFLRTVQAYNLNFVRLWRWSELVRFRYEDAEPFATSYIPYRRTGPGVALDGKPQFDLNTFDPAYFERLRNRVIAARDVGVYVSVMLFEGHAVKDSKPPWCWQGHPFHRDNNINDVNGDADGDGLGIEIHTLKIPAVTGVQEAYVRHVVDTLNDLDNVLFEISNETGSHSTDWQYHIVSYVKDYEKKKPKQHPVGMSFQYPGGSDQTLFDSPADWIAPGEEYRENPPASEGRKVILSDTDHFGGRPGSKAWVWKTFLRGLNPINYGLMGLAPESPAELQDAARAMGATRALASRVNLINMKPSPGLASTGFCLANAGKEYLIYQPNARQSFSVTLVPEKYTYQWFSSTDASSRNRGSVEVKGEHTFAPPLDGDAVLLLQVQ